MPVLAGTQIPGSVILCSGAQQTFFGRWHAERDRHVVGAVAALATVHDRERRLSQKRAAAPELDASSWPDPGLLSHLSTINAISYQLGILRSMGTLAL